MSTENFDTRHKKHYTCHMGLEVPIVNVLIHTLWDVAQKASYCVHFKTSQQPSQLSKQLIQWWCHYQNMSPVYTVKM